MRFSFGCAGLGGSAAVGLVRSTFLKALGPGADALHQADGDRLKRYPHPALWMYADPGSRREPGSIPSGNPFFDQFSAYFPDLRAEPVRGWCGASRGVPGNARTMGRKSARATVCTKLRLSNGFPFYPREVT